jgi:hypothetical protein
MACSIIDRSKGLRDRTAKTKSSCDLWIDPPGQVWEDYVHDVDELVMVITGEVEFEVAGQVHRPAPGEELLIRRGRGTSAEASRAGCTATDNRRGRPPLLVGRRVRNCRARRSW